jgi:1-aminocyclopropane-1-carboxylate deaminase
MPANFHSQFQLPSPLMSFSWPLAFRDDFEKRGLNLLVKQDNLIHPEISGNKWRKLRLNIEQAKALSKKGVLSFGGAYSNHLLALAAACREEGMRSMGLVRGDELNSESNVMLQRCADLGMELKFLSREEYGIRDDWDYLNELKSEFSELYIVPEGGKNFYGIIGCQDIIREIKVPFDDFWIAQGTCTTSTGIALSLPESIDLHVVPVLKGFDSKAEVINLVSMYFNDTDLAEELAGRMFVDQEAHFGGYGKSTPELEKFIKEVETDCNLKLDRTYTGKAFYAMCRHYTENIELCNKQIVFLHTGGVFEHLG